MPFGKPKEEKSKEKIDQEQADMNLVKQVHVMPTRYYLAPKKSNLGLIIAIVIGVLIIGVLSVAAFYLNETLKKAAQPKTAVPAVQPVNTNAAAPVPAVPAEPEVPSTTPAENVNTNTDVEIITPTTTPTNTNANTNTAVPPVPETPAVTAPANSADADKDGLTDVEENLYGTNPNSSDTDADSYSDGSEVLAGYDPKKANKKLSDSGIFNNYKNALYTIIYPNGWRVKENDAQGGEVLFISGGGEFVEVLVLDNPHQDSLEDWFKAQFENQPPVTTSLMINNFNVLREADDLNYYLLDSSNPGKVFLLTYNIGNAKEANFMTTFVTMVKNFKLLK